MKFEELQTEVFERGFDDLNDAGIGLTRVRRWLNSAYRELNDFTSWPYLEATKEGVAPLTIADLAHVLSVVDLTHENQLDPADRRAIVGIDPKITSKGIAVSWFMEGSETLRVYPLDTTSSFAVRYLKVPAELVAAGDVPILPAVYHELIVEGAVIRAYKNRDNYEAAQFVRQEWRLGVEGMVKALIKRNFDEEKTILRTGPSGTYL